MNITFLIGNGFDINLGLKTRYTDFYPYYLSQRHDDIISNAIANHYDRWADLELALGQMLREVSTTQISEFLDSKAILEGNLADYLREEQKRIDVTSATTQDELKKNLTCFYGEFSTKDQNAFLNWQRSVAENIFYQFISFNYTNVLDDIIAPLKKVKQFSTHSTSGHVYNDLIGNIVHIHGTLFSDLILGLDNEQQIENPQLQKAPELTNYVIKSAINEALGEEKINQAKKIISASNYVCVYGMSLGDTDYMWWKYLLSWLNANSGRRLVLYVYEEATANPSGPEKLRQQDKWKNTFLKVSGESQQNIDKLHSQIIVVLRSKIFDFTDIKLLKRETEETLANV